MSTILSVYVYDGMRFVHIELHACLCLRERDCVPPSFEERQCFTFHKGTKSLLKQELKPGGHGSACSVNRSSLFLAETCCGTLTLPLPMPCSSNITPTLFQSPEIS